MNKRIRKKKVTYNYYTKVMKTNYLIDCCFSYIDRYETIKNRDWNPHLNHIPWRFYLKQKNMKKHHTYIWDYAVDEMED